MTAQPLTPPNASSTPQLILCADGGGSKVCVVIRSEDGLEVRGTAGPCNVQSVGYALAAQSILLATYRALSLLPRSYLPNELSIPSLSPIPSPSTPKSASTPTSHQHMHLPTTHHLALSSNPASPIPSRPTTPSPGRSPTLPRLNVPIFRYAWLGLAGISCEADEKAFGSVAAGALGLGEDRVKVTNDVNLLAAPALDFPEVDHVVAAVAGTGTVGRTIRVASPSGSASVPDSEGKRRGLPLEDVAVSRGWGYLLCDEGSAFWMGRLAIRSLLTMADRYASTSIYTTPTPPFLPLHHDLLDYFGTSDPLDLITITSLTGPGSEGLDAGEATSRRNALIAGAARVVFRWAFPDDVGGGGLPTPPGSAESETTTTTKEEKASHEEALRLAKLSVRPMIELTTSLLGDGSVVKPSRTALALGGGLMMSQGYRTLLLEGLKKDGINFEKVVVVRDAAGEGARGLARVEFGGD
ncbi:hypothetical protein CI109_102130 [Kwoniella shandongensis]|uniref:Uncharacterized protein n=1 Tax=Kwoniella shandongensis TaxID=1734106 RepID=A0A5M6C3B6_9TREE|nr:uncharacterized protein CI109_003710 [Kwoniella shandongensis]KAA5528055.1 hypothetical protein CI109_003710 [Kwoniella shandongensis]